MTIKHLDVHREFIGLIGYLDEESTIEQVDEFKKELSEIYAEYLIEYQKDIVKEILSKNILLINTVEGLNHTFIYRPLWITPHLTQKPSLVLKFPRFTNDEEFLEKLKERGFDDPSI